MCVTAIIWLSDCYRDAVSPLLSASCSICLYGLFAGKQPDDVGTLERTITSESSRLFLHVRNAADSGTERFCLLKTSRSCCKKHILGALFHVLQSAGINQIHEHWERLWNCNDSGASFFFSAGFSQNKEVRNKHRRMHVFPARLSICCIDSFLLKCRVFRRIILESIPFILGVFFH